MLQKIKVIFILLLLFNSLNAKNNYIKNYSTCCYTKLGLVYINGTYKPFTGIIVKNEEHGMKSYIHILVGHRDGIMKKYFSNGKIYMIRNYENGFKNGIEKIYSKTGQLIQTTLYNNDKILNSKSIVYYENSSKIAGVVNIYNNKKVQIRTYRPDGSYGGSTAYDLK